MTEQDIRKIVRQEIATQKGSSSFTDLKLPNHSHNGLDSPRINLANAILNNKYQLSLSSDNSSGASAALASATFSAGIINPSSIKFFGFAYTSVTKVLVNGASELGTCFTANATNIISSPIVVEASSYGFLGSSSTVGSAPYLAYVESASTQVARLTVSAWTNFSITFEIYLEAGWSLAGQLLIT